MVGQQVIQRGVDGQAHAGFRSHHGIGRLRALQFCGAVEDVLRRVVRDSFRRRIGGRADLFDELGVARLDRRAGIVGKAPAHRRQRVARADRGDDGFVAQVVALGMRPHAARVDDQEAGALRVAHALHRRRNLFEEIGRGVIDAPGPQAEGGTACLDVAAEVLVRLGGLRNAVVFNNNQKRRRPDRGEVHGFVQQALAEGAVADHRGDDAAAAAQFARQRQADADAGHAALHAIRMKMSPDQMLAAAAAAASAGFASHDLGDETDEFAGIGKEMAVVTVIGECSIVRMGQRPDHRHGADFLAQAGMRGAGYQAARKLVEHQEFAGADQMAIGVEVFRRRADDRLAVCIARKSGYREAGHGGILSFEGAVHVRNLRTTMREYGRRIRAGARA